MKYEKWLKEWYKNYVEPSSKTKTRENYESIIEKRLIPEFGEYELCELTPFIIQKYITELLRVGNKRTGEGLSPNTVNGIVTVIQNSLKFAYMLGEIKEYSADKIKRPKKTEKNVSCFTMNEQKKIEKTVLNHKKSKMFGIVLCLYTGLRIGELLALEWKDVDFANRTLSVNKTCHDGKSADGTFCRIIESPKTQTSKRIIPLPKQIVLLLRHIKRLSDSNFVVSDKKGIPLSVRSYQSTFSRLLNKLNIEHRGFHSLRHTFATRALECNMDVKTLSEILGHKNAAITLNRYAHSMLEHKVEMMNKIGKLL